MDGKKRHAGLPAQGKGNSVRMQRDSLNPAGVETGMGLVMCL